MKTFTIARHIAVVGLGFLLFTVTGTLNSQTEPMKIHSGVIRSINLKSRLLTVGSLTAVITFSVPTDAEIIVKDKHHGADLDDLMVGDKVEVKYTADETGLIAHRIAILGLETPVSRQWTLGFSGPAGHNRLP